MTDLKCTYGDLVLKQHSIDFLCNTASKICADKQEFFNFFELYWCGLEGNNFLLIMLYVVGIFLIFKYTSITVDEYIAEGITKISDFLGFSEALSAVTLLAFANGAGDLITALVASGSEGGISYNIGALFGAGMFVCSVVVAICILQSDEDIVFDKMIIFRDVGIYLLSTVATIAFAIYGKITWWTSCILLALYVLLVIVVLVEEKYFNNQPKVDLENEEELASMMEMEKNKLRKGKDFLASVISSEKFQKYKSDLRQQGILDMRKGSNSGIYERSFGENQESLSMFLSVVRQVKYGLYVRKKTEMMIEHRNRPYEEKGYFDIIIEIFEYPFLFLLYLTALPTDESHYSKLRCMVFCFPGMIFFWYICHPNIDLTYVYIALPAGAALFLLFAYALPDNQKNPSWYIIISLIGVISGLMWTYILIGVLIDMLEVLGVLFHIEKTFLGLTVLAIGNALPDAMTTISLCKQGAGVLAISGGYAGQLFGYLIGFGISMLKVTLKRGPQEFDLFEARKLKQNLLDLGVIIVIFMILALTIVTGIARNYRMNKKFAWGLILLYGGFIIFSITVALKNALT